VVCELDPNNLIILQNARVDDFWMVDAEKIELCPLAILLGAHSAGPSIQCLLTMFYCAGACRNALREYGGRRYAPHIYN